MATKENTTALVAQTESTMLQWGEQPEKKATTTSNYDPEMWYSFIDGANKFRVVTPYKKYKAHSIKKNPLDQKDYGKEVKCSAVVKWEDSPSGKKRPVYQKGTCPACDLECMELEEGRPMAKDRWVFGVFDYRTSRYKIVKAGYSIFNLIETFAKDPDYGKPSQYDITIMKNSTKKPVSFIPKVGAKKPLEAAEQSAVDSKLDIDYLERLASPKTPAQIYKAMTYIRQDLDALFLSYGLQRPIEAQGSTELPEAQEEPKPAPKKAKPVVATNTKAVKVVEETPSDDSEEDFPSA